jgi:hypothetical protein
MSVINHYVCTACQWPWFNEAEEVCNDTCTRCGLQEVQPHTSRDSEPWFRNHYQCPCGTEWSDEWSATCDDRCPSCNTPCSPTESEDLDEEQTEAGAQYLVPSVKPVSAKERVQLLANQPYSYRKDRLAKSRPMGVGLWSSDRDQLDMLDYLKRGG